MAGTSSKSTPPKKPARKKATRKKTRKKTSKKISKKIRKKPLVNAIDDQGMVAVIEADGLHDDADHFELPGEVAVLPIRNTVAFPGTIVPLSIQRDKSAKLLNDVLPDQKVVMCIAQRDPHVEDPSPDDLFEVGTAMMVLKLFRTRDNTQNVIVQGLSRVRVVEWIASEPFLRARIEPVAELVIRTKHTEALLLNVRNLARQAVELSPNIPEEALTVLNNIDEPGALADFLASNLQLDLGDKQTLLEETDVVKRLESVSVHLQRQIDLLELSDKIQGQVRANVDKTQREYFLNEQLKAIRKELGQYDEKTVELAELKEKIAAAKMSKPAAAEASRELGKLEKLPTAAPEYNVTRTYLDILCELPWSLATEDQLDVGSAKRILDRDHFGLSKVKRRILEYLAVRSLAPKTRGPILCFVGPPGVGKTSLGQSIARAMGRKFIRMSLGGMRDEAELRGHRRTYIGAMPGRIIQEIRKAGANNPVFMLDELDKVGSDFHGDPTSALLEILDPAQNATFQDHYLNVPFDLSDVMFIATANYMGSVPPALRDRMEVISLPGYTQREKLQIAKRYLVKRQRTENGLKATQIRWNDEALRLIVEQYTREAGVRTLERQIGAISRGIAAKVAGGSKRSRPVTKRLITELLGPRQFENELAQRTAVPGVATGLAYTPVGGTILFIESTMYPGRGHLILTGQIGDVMKESAQAAWSVVKTRAAQEGKDMDELGKQDVHVHVPAGAVPKDGPSAGVAMFISLVSLLTKRPVRPDVAMTGEVTLRGLVLPIGGVKEKVLAAKAAGIKKVILPAANKKDLHDVPADIRDSLDFVFARRVDDAIKAALLPEKKKK